MRTLRDQGMLIRTIFPSANVIIGKQGVGKSTLGKRIIENDFESGDFCCIDLTDFGRMENACYALPNTHKEIYDRFNNVLRTHDPTFNGMKFTPKAYPTIVYVPAVRGIPKKLPNIFQPFRIVFQDLEFDEFILLCGFRGDEVAIELLELAWSSKKNTETFEEFVKRAILMAGYGSMLVKIDERSFEVDTAERRSFAPLLRRLKRLWDSSLICDRGDYLGIDLDTVMCDKRKIHCFSMAYITDVSIPFLIYGYILRKIYALRLRQAERYPNLSIFIREGQKIAPYSAKYQGQEISRSNLSALVRECRDIKVWVYMDTQDPRSLDWEIRGSVIYTWFIFRSDKIVVSWLNELFDIPDTVKFKIPKYQIGMCATKFDVVRHPCLYDPPLSLIKAYNEQFIVLWKEMGGGYTTWDIKHSDTSRMITFSIPEKPVDALTGKEESMFDRHVGTWMRYLDNRESETIDELCRLVNINVRTFSNHIKNSPKFKGCLTIEDGIVRRIALPPLPDDKQPPRSIVDTDPSKLGSNL